MKSGQRQSLAWGSELCKRGGEPRKRADIHFSLLFTVSVMSLSSCWFGFPALYPGTVSYDKSFPRKSLFIRVLTTVAERKL